jgi:hypothetical protein
MGIKIKLVELTIFKFKFHFYTNYEQKKCLLMIILIFETIIPIQVKYIF